MYQQGDRVVYGIHGVCLVKGQEQRVLDRKIVTYLVLEPLGQEGARYLIPTHNEAAMGKLRPILTAEELETLLCSDEIRMDCWNRDENARKQRYRELIGSGDRISLLAMVHTLHRHKKNRSQAGQKIHLADENFLRDAERLLSGEIAAVKGISRAEAQAYLRKCLETE